MRSPRIRTVGKRRNTGKGSVGIAVVHERLAAQGQFSTRNSRVCCLKRVDDGVFGGDPERVSLNMELNRHRRPGLQREFVDQRAKLGGCGGVDGP